MSVKGEASITLGTGDVYLFRTEDGDSPPFVVVMNAGESGAIGLETQLSREPPVVGVVDFADIGPFVTIETATAEGLDQLILGLLALRSERFPDAEQLTELTARVAELEGELSETHVKWADSTISSAAEWGRLMGELQAQLDRATSDPRETWKDLHRLRRRVLGAANSMGLGHKTMVKAGAETATTEMIVECERLRVAIRTKFEVMAELVICNEHQTPTPKPAEPRPVDGDKR